MPSLSAIGAETIASLIATLGLGLIAIVIVELVIVRRRKELYRFFGVRTGTPTVDIRASHLNIVAKGAASRKGEPEVTTGFTGAAIIRSEYLAALEIQALLTSRRGALVHMPDSIERWLRRRRATWARAVVSIDVAPPTPDVLSDRNLVLLGSRVYNSLCWLYFDHTDTELRVKFGRVNDRRAEGGTRRTITVKGDAVPAKRATLENDGTELAVIQRRDDPREGRCVIGIYGFGAAATAAATTFLVKEWQTFAKLPDDFAVVLRYGSLPRDLSVREGIERVKVEPRVMWIVTASQCKQFEGDGQFLQEAMKEGGWI